MSQRTSIIKRVKDWALAAGFFLSLWCIVSYLLRADPYFLAAPHQVAKVAWSEVESGRALANFSATLGRTIVGILFGTAIGILLGILLAHAMRIRKILEPAVDFCRAVPVIALYPVFLYIFGIGDRPIVLTASWAASFLLAINVYYGLRRRVPERQFLLNTYGATKAQHMWLDRLPGSLPYIFAGLRLAVTYGLVIVIVGEMFFPSARSVGYTLYESWEVKQIARMYAYILMLGFVGVLLNAPFRLIESRMPWLRVVGGADES